MRLPWWARAAGGSKEALPLLAHKLIPLEEMISARYPLRQAPEAFDHAGRRGR